ncbi:MAG: malonyl-CoA decarboxylase family protein [Bacteroidia bacterium]|nr:malonyl-CoA decarboxylase family protein [Bacteroidia bacterium]
MDQIITAWEKSGNPPPIINPDILSEDKKSLINLMKECINEEGGDMSRKVKVVHLGMIYISLSKKGKERFLRILARNLDVDTVLLDEKISILRSSKNETERIKAELMLRKALIPPRVVLLRHLIKLPNGFIFLKDMRRDLLPMIKSIPRLKKLDIDIENLLSAYFDVNLLDLQEITWNSPAALLEKLMEYEEVHKIHSWEDLKHRLFTDHKVFAFFHFRMPNDPLIFLEVALVNGMPGSIRKLLDVHAPVTDPAQADTAIFYSISNTQKGLAGISYGNFLIKRVVENLSKELPNLKTFATLSPIPRFCQWLYSYLQDGGDGLFSTNEANRICKFSGKRYAREGLLEMINSDSWYKSGEKEKILKKPLMRLCTHYLIHVKRGKGAFDPVAHFHLSNGAKIQHIHWMADVSNKGIKQSCGIMLNYHYRLNKIVQNHETYLTTGEVYASKDARSWLK